MATPEPAECLNCGAAPMGAYCANCGQKRPHTDLTLREFVRETTVELTSLDGKVLNSLKALFFRPGLLTADFLAGRRARWLLPLRLYLVCSLAFFLIKPVVEGITRRPMREMADVTITDESTPEGRKELEEGLPARIFGAERLKRAAADNQRLNRAIDSAFPKAMFVLLPLFALLTSLAWRGRNLRYPAHVYFALHVHAAVFGVLAVAMLATAFVPDAIAAGVVFAAIAYGLVYTLIAMRRVFGDSWTWTTGKAALIAAGYLACFIPVALAMLAVAIFSM